MTNPEHFAAIAARHFPRIQETPMTQPATPAFAPPPQPPVTNPAVTRIAGIAEIARWWRDGTIADPAAAMTHICNILGVKK